MIEVYYNAEKLRFKVDDIPKPLELKILDEQTQQPIDLVGAEAIFGVYSISDNDTASSLFDPRAASVDETNGVLTHTWEEGDLNTAGKFFGFFMVTFADASVLSFPQQGYLVIEIEKLA